MKIHMSNNQYPKVAYMNGYKGIHVKNGIYKLEQPLRVNIDEWCDDTNYTDYVVAPTNYSSNYEECDIVYFAHARYDSMGDMVIELNTNNHNNKFGYVQNSNSSMSVDFLVGGIEVEI